jgi:hypothetical protein
MGGKKRVCEFPWCKYSHDGQVQVNFMMSLTVELRRDKHPEFCEPAPPHSGL